MINRIKKALLAGTAVLLMAPASWAALSSYSQDFEALNPLGATALSGAGFLVAGVVFDGAVAPAPYGNKKFFYGNFPAPNGAVAFSGIATGEGGAPQGSNVLNAFSDYQCCVSTGEGHFDTVGDLDFVQSGVFQQQVIGPADIGTTWSFKFDAKANLVAGCGSAPVSDCVAFIRTQSGPVDTNFITFDAQTLSGTWSTQTLSINLSDPSLNGQVLQFGFQSTSKEFGNTGVFYDNIFFGVDGDLDGAPNIADNCRSLANNTGAGAQADSDADSFGNRCDGDLNNNNATNAQDYVLFRAQLGASSVAPVFNKADINANGAVNAQDYVLFRGLLGAAPGPGAGP